MPVMTEEDVRCSICDSPLDKRRGCTRNCGNVYDPLYKTRVKCTSCGKENLSRSAFVDYGNGSIVCKACLSAEQNTSQAYGVVWERGGEIVSPYYLEHDDEECKHVKQGKWPRTRMVAGVFIASNEGGWSSVGVCLECLKEQAEELGI